MRDAFGGVFMIRLMLVFIFLYVIFTALALNYAKAFRIKNSIIDLIEQTEIKDLNEFSEGNAEKVKKLNKILINANYFKECKNGNGLLNRKPGEPQAYCHNGVIIEQSSKNSKYIIYNVYTYADWNLGPLSMILNLAGETPRSDDIINGTWEISGEAKVRIRA